MMMWNFSKFVLTHALLKNSHLISNAPRKKIHVEAQPKVFAFPCLHEQHVFFPLPSLRSLTACKGNKAIACLKTMRPLEKFLGDLLETMTILRSQKVSTFSIRFCKKLFRNLVAKGKKVKTGTQKDTVWTVVWTFTM